MQPVGQLATFLCDSDELLGLGRPTVIAEPAADDDGDEADEQRQHDVRLGIAKGRFRLPQGVDKCRVAAAAAPVAIALVSTKVVAGAAGATARDTTCRPWGRRGTCTRTGLVVLLLRRRA